MRARMPARFSPPAVDPQEHDLTTTRPRTPANLGADGRRLFRAVVDEFDLRADELLLLVEAARTADDCARLDAAVASGPLLVTGSTGQDVANPLLRESRQSRALLGSLLRQLGLPDTAEDADRDHAAGRPSSASDRAIAAARARWGSAVVGVNR